MVGPAGRTGSPGDATDCSECHSGTPVYIDSLISSNIPSSGYIPGNTYNISTTLKYTGRSRFGFEVSPQNISGAVQGSLILSDPTNTQLIGSGKYITHKLAGTLAPSGSRTWTFKWIAPADGSGDITFYGAYNASNNNGTISGDIILLSKYLVHENTLSSNTTSNNVSLNKLRAHANLTTKELHLSCSGVKISETVKIILLNANLTLQEVIYNAPWPSVSENITLNFSGSLPPGVYFISIESGGLKEYTKVLIGA